MARSKNLERLGHRRTVAPPAPGEGVRGYPRPLLRRSEWTSLNGTWDLAIDYDGIRRAPAEIRFDRTIEVPYAVETARSGVADTGLHRAVWYRRAIRCAPPPADHRVILHFGAVDYLTTIWIDRSMVLRHEGGYTPFSADITDHVADGAEHELVVCALDDPGDLGKPRGKQDWQLEPHSIWYPRTSGIWQTVWLETVPSTRLSTVRWSSQLASWELSLEAHVLDAIGKQLRLEVILRSGDVVLTHDSYSVGEEVHRRIALSDPGIDDFRNELLWSPESPTLLDAELTLIDAGSGAPIDRVTSYTALRSFAIEGDRFVLNGRPYPLRMVLDQGYWPDTGLTAPDDEALRRDVELTKAMGFNGARKHQKIEDPRYLYWCDRLGLLVWEEMPSAYRFTRRSIERLTRQWVEVLKRDVSHPCIVAWVPFNESWGVPNLAENVPERHYVEALYHLTKTLDPWRPVVGNDGWEAVATDILGIHDYDSDTDRIAARYATHERLPALLARERPGGRALLLGPRRAEHPIVLSEFGGIALSRDRSAWGYSSAAGPEDLEARYTALMAVVGSLAVLAGFCYTQLTDTFQEANGLLYMDRTPKFPIERIRNATLGPRKGASPLGAEANLTEREAAP